MKRRIDLLLLLPLCALLGWLQWQYDGYIKDDTYIALRYSRNLAEGLGLVFNHGQKLEGYTDFLWIVLTVPAFWLNVDPVVWVKAMGVIAGQAGLFLTYAIARHFGGPRDDFYPVAGAVAWSCSSTVVLWSMAGLEPILMAVLCSGGILYALKLWGERGDGPKAVRYAWVAGLLLTAGALCRPEGHAVVLFAAAVGLADAARQRRIPRPWLLCAGIIAAVLLPYHAWRVWYFGAWVPNTFLVKASVGAEIWDQGVKFAGELLGFQANPGIFALAVVALLGRRQWFSKLVAAALGLFFLAYLVKVGRDEMKWFRLYLPVYPLVVALAADGLRQVGEGLNWPADRLTEAGLRLRSPVLQALLVDLPGRVGRERRHTITAVLLVVAVAVPTLKISLDFGLKHAPRHDMYLKWSEQSFQKMGEYVDKRSAPGEVVLFQDMGAAPFVAGDLRWVDTIGILDRTVATELANTGVNPFLRSLKRREPGGGKALREMDERLRDYFLAQDPSWAAFIAYIPKSKRRGFWRKYRKVRGDDDYEEELFLPYIKRNGHSHYLASDPRFERSFHYVRAWDRLNHGYWVVLYRHNDQVDVRDR